MADHHRGLAVVALLTASLLVGGCRDGVLDQMPPPGTGEEVSTPGEEASGTSAGAADAGGKAHAEELGAAHPVGAPGASAAARGEKGELPTVTTERIDVFLAYQERRLELEKALWADLASEEVPVSPGRAAPRKGAPGGSEAPTAASLRRLEQRAEEDAEALEAAGLTPAELEALGSLIRDVLSPRQLARELALEETVTLLEEQAERLEGAQRQELLDQVGPLRERMTTLRSLAEVRAAHGDAAVEAVLAREEALLAWQEARLTTLLEDPSGKGEGQAGGRR